MSDHRANDVIVDQLAEALVSTDPKIRALVMEIEAVEPGAIERLAAALRLERIACPRAN